MSLAEYVLGEEPVIQDIKIRKCTEEDWQDFNTPTKKFAAYFEAIKKRDNMYCISPAD